MSPGCYDALSARVMERAGHDTAFVSGCAVRNQSIQQDMPPRHKESQNLSNDPFRAHQSPTYKLALEQVSATLLGEPDMGLLTPPEMARKVGQICTAAPSLAVFADADTGGISALNEPQR